jgi:hypothetical protein
MSLQRSSLKCSVRFSCLHLPSRHSSAHAALLRTPPEVSTPAPQSQETHYAGPSYGIPQRLRETFPASGTTLDWSNNPDAPISSNGRKHRKVGAAHKRSDLDPHEKLPKRNKRKKAPPPHRNLLDETKVEQHLAFVKATKTTVTLADIERCQPPKHSHPGSQQYETDYNTLLDTLVRSFSTKQLRTFVQLYNLEPHLTHWKRTKWDYAVSIIEHQWNWPSLTQIQKEQRDRTEVTCKSM